MQKIKAIKKNRRLLYAFTGVLVLALSIWIFAINYNAEAKLAGGGQLSFKQISSSYTHSCAIASDYKAYCWGGGLSGQLGNGGSITQSSPVAVSQGAMPAGATIRQIAVGNAFSCAVASDDKAYCWGAATAGKLGNGSTTPNQNTPVAVSQGAMPAGATIRQIAVGSANACAVASDNKAYCWGSATNGALGNGTTTPSQSAPVAVSLGAMPAGAMVRQISVGSANACALASDNKAYCWGAAANGALGNGTATPNQTTPVAVLQGAMPAGATIRQVAVSSVHSCAIASDNKAYCWGYGLDGQMGNNSTLSRSTPVAVSLGAMPAGTTIRQIAVSSTHSCAIASDNKTYCWGAGGGGQLGNGTTTVSQTTPVAVSQGSTPAGSTTREIAVGASHSCAIASDNKAYCWGDASNGPLGNGTTTPNQTTPVAVSTINRTITAAQSVFRFYGPSASISPGSPLAGDNTSASLGAIGGDFRLRIGLTNLEGTNLDVDTMSSGNGHSCAIASNHKAYCWGSNQYGQLGNSVSATVETTPVTVALGTMPAGTTIREIAAGGYSTCAIASDNKVYCWGYGGDGQIGNGASPGAQTTPVAVSLGAMPAGTTAKEIDVGLRHACVVASDNKAYCWGTTASGQLGNGVTAGVQNTPVAVSLGAMPAGTTIRQISTGNTHACALASDNKAYCWGTVTGGSLGNGSTSSNTPVAVSLGTMPAGSTIRQISVGYDTSCAVASDNKAYCWGYGADGSLGNGSFSHQSTPVAVSLGAMPAGATVRRVSPSRWAHVCFLASDNKVYCTGEGYSGQFGSGVSHNSNVPVATVLGTMPAGATVQQLSSGYVHTCAIASDNKAYCWGDGQNGRVGNGASPAAQLTPVAVSAGTMTDANMTTIGSGLLNLDLQVAPLGASPTCSVVVTGWASVTTTSDMNWGSAPPSHTTAISTFGSDPVAPTGGGYAYQSIVQSGSFANNLAIAPQQTGLWDFVLHDRSSKSSTSYCFRIVSNTAGNSIDTYSQYPRVATAPGALGLQFVDNGGTPLSGVGTNTGFSSLASKGEAQTSTGTLTDNLNKQLEAHNSTSNSGWNVSLAATDGPTALWQSGINNYDYNAASSASGQLSINMSGSSHTAHGTTPAGDTCVTTNVTRGSSSTYSGVVSAITLVTGSPSAQFNCSWRVRDVVLSQTIPPSQAAGSYSLDMIATIVAS